MGVSKNIKLYIENIDISIFNQFINGVGLIFERFVNNEIEEINSDVDKDNFENYLKYNFILSSSMFNGREIFCYLLIHGKKPVLYLNLNSLDYKENKLFRTSVSDTLLNLDLNVRMKYVEGDEEDIDFDEI
jgi:hypothetical protein